MATEARTATPILRFAGPLLAIASLVLPGIPGAQVTDSVPHGLALVDLLEAAPTESGVPIRLDAAGWWGGDVNRLWVRLEGDVEGESGDGEAQLEALYGRLVSPFWDAVVGVRVDRRWEGGPATRAHLAVGVAGLAPYWFEVQPTIYLSQDGHVSAQVEAEYELLVTQRLVLQPRLEVQLALQDAPEFGVGAGLSDLELGARLRYELRRELAPYVGIVWHRRFGETADLARTEGSYVSDLSLVAGLRAWY